MRVAYYEIVIFSSFLRYFSGPFFSEKLPAFEGYVGGFLIR